MRQLQHAEIVLMAADDLHTDRQPLGREAAWNGYGRQPSYGDEVTRPHPVDVRLHRHAVDLAHVPLVDVERRDLAYRADEKFVALHELAHAMIQLGALAFGPAELRSGKLATCFDVPDHGVFQ